MLIPATPISSAAAAAAVTPPSVPSLMMHHQQHQHQHQHPHHPSNREAALAFAALLKTLQLPSQRLVKSLPQPVTAATASQQLTSLQDVLFVEESMLENDAEEDAFQKLLEAPVVTASIPAASSFMPPGDWNAPVETANSFAPRSDETIFASSPSAVVLEEEDHPFDDDDSSDIFQISESDLSHNQTKVSKLQKQKQQQQQLHQQPRSNYTNNINNSKMSLLEVQGRILHLVSRVQVDRALQLFYDTVDQQQQQQILIKEQQQQQQQHTQEAEEEFLSMDSVKQLFFLVSKKKRPFDSYRVLLYYQRAVQHLHAAQQQQQQNNVAVLMDDASAGMSKPENNNNNNNNNTTFALYDVGMYERMCDTLRFLDPDVHSYKNIDGMVRCVIADVMHKFHDRDGGDSRAPITANHTSTTTATATTTRTGKDSTSAQERCIPILVSALAQQRSVRLGRNFCPKLYQHMMDHNFYLSAGYLQHLSGLSKFHRQDDLPFASILHKAVVERNRLVEAVTVLNVVENLFPYTDMVNVKLALESLIHLVKMENKSGSARAGEKNTDGASTTTTTRYKVDISILEAMGAAAAKRGATNVCLLIWDLLDVLNYDEAPSVMIYENTVIAFCQAGPSFYPNVFVLLKEMQSRHGYALSRALIRGLSTRFRYSHENLDAALDAFLDSMATTASGTEIGLEGSLPLPHSVNAIAGFNAIVSARAERGDLDHALELLDRIQTSDNADNSDNEAIDVVANADTYGFLFEAVGKHLVIRRRQLQHRRDRQEERQQQRQQQHRHHHHEEDENNDEEMLLQKCWQCANDFLTLMENQGIAPTTHILREYIELLCQMNDISTATAIVREFIQSSNDNTSSNTGNVDNGQQPAIGNKTLYRVAVANAHAQKFDVAREIAEMGSVYNHEPMPFLLYKLNNMERANTVQDDVNQYGDHHGDEDF
jgi:hypothetical protein